MVSVRGIVGRLRGDRVAEVERQVAAVREAVLEINHVVNVTLGTVAPIERSIGELRQGLGDDLREAASSQSAELAAIVNVLSTLNHTAATTADTVAKLAATVEVLNTVLLQLNHDVRSGSEDALPLFLGYTERLRLDTDTAIGAAQVIERQLALLEGLVGGEPERS